MKLRFFDERKKGEFYKTVRSSVMEEESGESYILLRYKGSKPKTAFAEYLLENLDKIKKRARANKENIRSKNLVYEIEYPPGKQEKKSYIIKMPDFDIMEDRGMSEQKARSIEHEFYSNVYLHELLEYPMEYGFGEKERIVPLPSCLIFNQKTNEIIFVRNSVINTPLSIIAGERVSDIVARNTILNTAIALALFTRLGIHHDMHFANIGVDFSSNKCSVVFFDLENFIPIEWIKKTKVPEKIFSSLSSTLLVLIGVGIIRNVEQVEMFKDKYLEVNETWILENNPEIIRALNKKNPFASNDREIALYRALTELRLKNLAKPAFWMPEEITQRVMAALYFLWKAVRILTAGRV
ncbi:MAG: hypothetical protein QXY61_02280 [Candidatus Anstonellales archaeon]